MRSAVQLHKLSNGELLSHVNTTMHAVNATGPETRRRMMQTEHDWWGIATAVIMRVAETQSVGPGEASSHGG